MLLTCISTDKTSFVSRFLFNTVSTFLFVYMVQIGLQYGSNWIAIWPILEGNSPHLTFNVSYTNVASLKKLLVLGKVQTSYLHSEKCK